MAKTLIVRSAMTGAVPSAGVATAISSGIEVLREHDGARIFNPASITEDYEIAHRLHQLGRVVRFVRFRATMPRSRRARVDEIVQTTKRELVSTQELFPDHYQTSVRQKARWMLGIAYLGWHNIGWYGNFWDRYFLMRDRKAIITAPSVMVAYLLVVGYLFGLGVVAAFPALGPLPPLITKAWVWTVVLVNFAFLLSRLLQRAWFVGRAHGMGFIWLSPIRAVIGNFIAFSAFIRATRIFLGIRWASRPIVWDKTDHHYPNAALVNGSDLTIADILQHEGHVGPADVARALATIKKTGRPLGLQLLDQGVVSDLALAKAYAELERRPYMCVNRFADPGRDNTPRGSAHGGAILRSSHACASRRPQ